MFEKILIANRGEIACRIIKTARRMGIKTVAVYSDADAAALHVEMADEAVHLGPPPAAQSYLLGDRIVAACLETGAQAVHPGYGFLSERTWFAESLAAAGIAFIGPPPAAIAAMGDKIESKKLARAAGVSVVPGYVGEIADADEALKIATEIGFPVMIKASAGGGGKGMRIAYTPADVREGFDGARAEAVASFGDDRIFIEKFVEQPRHIEIQLLGDMHGNIVYLGERECSIQRRHQKVIEEAPSPFVTPDMRAQMGREAVELARAVGYFSAGTVEFIAGADRRFYFLEMNTRLQVEHPVTEYVTGLDLVEQMLRVAAGEKLSFSQSDIKLNGWAMESRVYAEDPYRGFLPSTGRLTGYRQPALSGSVRVDTGVVEGSEISMFYDPMIAKLVTHGPNRAAAIAAQIDALDAYHITGIGHNIDFLSAVMQHPRFQSGNITTGFIAEEYPDGFTGAPMADARLSELVALAAVLSQCLKMQERGISNQLSALDVPEATQCIVVVGASEHVVDVQRDGESWQVMQGSEHHNIDTAWHLGDAVATATINGAVRTVGVSVRTTGFAFTTQGCVTEFAVYTPRAAALARHMIAKAPADMSKFLLCPMPGLIVSIDGTEGMDVQAGQPLAIVEAMKMQNILRAEKAGKISRVCVKPGDSLAVDAVIIEFA